LAGWIGYEVAGELEHLGFGPGAGSELPRMHFGLYDSVLIADPQGGWSLAGTDAWRGNDGSPQAAHHEDELLHRAAAISLPPLDCLGKLSAGPLRTRTGAQSFEKGVERIVRRIRAGDLFETNLCRRLEAPLRPGMAWPLYRRMRALSPAEYGAFLQAAPGGAILSISPEMFLKVNNGVVESRPIKGTRRRGRTSEEDRSLMEQLLHSPKDRAELAMVVDVTRNDLSRVCEPGSVQVFEHAALLTLPTLHHTYSRLSGRLRRETTAADLLRAAFPPASITGAPKIAAMEAAFAEERIGRGPCMGSIGWISLDGDMELSVAIRTAVVSGGSAVYLAGCGITADSIPLQELQESQAKASAFVEALGLQDGESETKVSG